MPLGIVEGLFNVFCSLAWFSSEGFSVSCSVWSARDRMSSPVSPTSPFPSLSSASFSVAGDWVDGDTDTEFSPEFPGASWYEVDDHNNYTSLVPVLKLH